MIRIQPYPRSCLYFLYSRHIRLFRATLYPVPFKFIFLFISPFHFFSSWLITKGHLEWRRGRALGEEKRRRRRVRGGQILLMLLQDVVGNRWRSARAWPRKRILTTASAATPTFRSVANGPSVRGRQHSQERESPPFLGWLAGGSGSGQRAPG